MQTMKKYLLFSTMIAATMSMQAKVELPEIISDNMVLQQQTDVNLWGKAKANTAVKVTTSWAVGASYEVKADKDGNWIVAIPTPQASFQPQTVTISDGEDVTLKNVLIGEVWFTSGQSNMEMPLNGFWNCPIKDSNTEIATAAEWAGRIRMATVPKTGKTEPQETVQGKWQVPAPDTAPWMSATSWYFAQMMTRTLNVPVGIICCAWGGSRVEGWTPENILRTYPDVNIEEELKGGWNKGGWWEYWVPLVMYNGMLHPLRHYTIKGFLWYQGEANVGKEKDYAPRLKTMVEVWRKDFSEDQKHPLGDNLPFYLAEIAPWEGYGGRDGLSGALLREAQHEAGRIIPNSGCITTNDLVKPYEDVQIHPAEKRLVGYRFAWMALNRTYGMKSIWCDGPEYDHMDIKGKEIEVFFKYADEGISPWNEAEGFEVAGEDGVFHPAKAKLNEGNKSFIVSSDKVQQPKNVRYCFKNFQIGNVVNHRNLPLVPFRTDK